MTAPLLQLRGVSRTYAVGEGNVAALREVTLAIQAGEWVAIMGPSGSGKTTLMNILGCLDRPTAGAYAIGGWNVTGLNPDELATLRRERFGFIFQRYNLIQSLTALANVEVPAVYAGEDTHARHKRANTLLERLGVSDRSHYRPNQLSGGQQQRIAIARALMNNGQILLADEPTGALDSHAGAEVLEILTELHAHDHTIILVTHNIRVAEHAQRVIELRDGQIVTDYENPYVTEIAAERKSRAVPVASHGRALRGRFLDALRMAGLAMAAHRLRSFLTMLGIIIGIASVASVVALGIGGRDKVLNDIRVLGTNTLDVYPGHGFGDEKALSVETLRSTDATALAEQPYVDAVSPLVSTRGSVRFGNVAVSAVINGVGDQYFRVHPFEIERGHTFTADDVRSLAQVVVIDEKAAERLFGAADPIGRVVLIGSMPARVTGSGKPGGTIFSGVGGSLNVWMPYTSVTGRLMGPMSLRSITVRICDDTSMEKAAGAVTDLLTKRHGSEDFFFFNTDTIRKSVESATATMTFLVSSIAVISLVVGGIGVMNIMLVSVTERTREIGIRMAVGGRPRDIRQQFLIEAIVVCAIGGALGVFLSLFVGLLVTHLSSPIPYAFSPLPMLAALIVSTLIGVTFGYFPAAQAAALNPVDALARE